MLIRLILLLTVTRFAVAQPGNDIEMHINSLIAQGDETANLRLYDLLVYYYDNPIDLNKVQRHELMQLSLLDEQQVEAIIAYRNKIHHFTSLYELQAIEALSLADIKKIWPFIVVPERTNLGKTFKGLGTADNNYLTTSYAQLLEEVRGIKENIYLGSPQKAQMRLRLRNPGKLSIGLAMQKDPGEPWLQQKNIPRPDYVTGHLYLENQGRLKQLALGDYRLQFGQGLLLGAGFMSGKNAETVTTIKQATLGILPYSSVTESNFFRGLAVKVQLLEPLTLSLFYSGQQLDATPIDPEATAVSGFRTGGLHRTASEIAAMDQLREQVWGTGWHFRGQNFDLGGVLVRSNFDKTIVPPARAYNHFRFSGRSLLNFSLFGEYRLNNFTWFGEMAKTATAGWAFSTGILGQVAKYAGLSLSIRYLEKDFQSLYGRSFTERSVLGNENGIYWGLKLKPNREITILGYYDIYRFPWLTSSTAAPSTGKDIMLRLEYRFNKENQAFIQLRSEAAEQALMAQPADQIGSLSVLKSILNFDFATTSVLSFRSRLQYNIVDNEEAGVLVLQDINYSNLKFGLSARVLFFDTESFSSRQYVYEKDMLFSYNTRAFFGRGMSYYVLVKYKPIRPLSIRAKLSFTEYLGVNEIGSGYNMISGNTRTQISAQLHYKF